MGWARACLLSSLVAASLASLSPGPAILTILSAWILTGGHRTLYLVWHTGRRDTVVISRFLHILYKTGLAKWRDQAVGDLFLLTAARLPDKTMMIMAGAEGEQGRMTFREGRDLACRVASFFDQAGLRKGDKVALVLENRLDYCCYWLGLSMLGVVPALVNNNLRQQSLLHTLTVAECKAVVFSLQTEAAVLEITPQLPAGTQLFCADRGAGQGGAQLPDLLAAQPASPPHSKQAGYNDPLVYIYTSGTTGMPKAAVVKHSRYLFAVYALFCGTLLTEDDVIYSPLPMYHTAAGAMITGQAVCEGVTVVTRPKFSASKWWADCCEHGVTCAQYIGEIARYLYASPVGPLDTQHNVRMMFGNGMRPQLWQKFVDRFHIPRICEYYGSTEGNCSCSNLTGEKVGAVGFVSVLFPFILPLGIVRVDGESGEPVRDGGTGLAVVCGPDEPGELVGKIEPGHPVRDFHGYADNTSTNKKILKDVYSKGDLYFRSGDILVMDEFGWLYFKDRAGDTFRWKGENVSTLEVEATLSQLIGLRDCVVYGVEIPGTEGRAGMAAIPDPERKVEAATLYSSLQHRLPAYARPLFLRFVTKLDFTGTYKPKKKALQAEGFNVEQVVDEVFMLDSKTNTYTPLTLETYTNILNGNIRF